MNSKALEGAARRPGGVCREEVFAALFNCRDLPPLEQADALMKHRTIGPLLRGEHLASAAPASVGVTMEELMDCLPAGIWDGPVGYNRPAFAFYLLGHPRLGPLLRGEGAPAPKRVVLWEEVPINVLGLRQSLTTLAGEAYRDGCRDAWAFARAEVERQQGQQGQQESQEEFNLRAALAAELPTPTLAELMSPHPGYQPGDGREEGAQLVEGAWWAPVFGCNSLDTTLEVIGYRIALYLREQVAGVDVAGVDVPGPDGDWGGMVELCLAQGVEPELGVPLLQRARKAWDVGDPPAPAQAAEGPAVPDEVREAFAELERREHNLRVFRNVRAAMDADLPAQPPAPATTLKAEEEGEREELAQWLEQERLDYGIESYPIAGKRLHRAAALLREPAPAPVPVSVAERPWERPGWCDAEGRCWWGRCADEIFNPEWALATYADIEEFCSDAMPSLTLPHWAIPTPQPPQGGEAQ